LLSKDGKGAIGDQCRLFTQYSLWDIRIYLISFPKGHAAYSMLAAMWVRAVCGVYHDSVSYVLLLLIN
jgi:hypothetical protein